MKTARDLLYEFNWLRIARVAVLVVIFFIGFDIVLAKSQYVVVPREGRRNPKDNIAFIQMCSENLPKKGTGRRIFYFGDSIIQGSGRISQKHTVPAQLEKILKKKPGWEDVEVYNFGMVGAMPPDLLAAFLLFSDFECATAIVGFSHRKYGLAPEMESRINYRNLLEGLTAAELKKNEPLGEIYDERPFFAHLPQRMSATLRRLWFFYSFHSFWQGYFDSQDFKEHWQNRDGREISHWMPGQVKIDRFKPLNDTYAKIARHVEDRDNPNLSTFKRIFETAREKNIPLKIYISPFDFTFISDELKIPSEPAKKAIVVFRGFFRELMGPMGPGWAFRDYSDALEPQVNFIDHEHLAPDGCRRLAEIIAQDMLKEN